MTDEGVETDEGVVTDGAVVTDEGVKTDEGVDTDATPNSGSPTGVSRRAVLAGVFGAGVLGTAGGLGTAALLGDAEGFEALFTAGAVDLWVNGESSTTTQFDLALDPANPVGTARIELALPPLPTGVNNPAYVRMRSECPVIGGEAPFSVPDAVSLSVDYLDCATDGVGDGVVAGTLRSLYEDPASPLFEGVLLDGQSRDVPTDDRVAFEPGTTVCLQLTWTLDPAALDDAERSVSVTFHFDALQARHFTGFESPATVPCTFDAPESRISFVAFCSATDEVRDGDISFVPELVGTGDEYDSIRWSMTAQGVDTQLSTVVLFYANTFENFAVAPGDRSGVATIGDGTPGTPDQHPSSPGLPGESCVKYEWEDGSFVLADADDADNNNSLDPSAGRNDASDDGVNDVDNDR